MITAIARLKKRVREADDADAAELQQQLDDAEAALKTHLAKRTRMEKYIFAFRLAIQWHRGAFADMYVIDDKSAEGAWARLEPRPQPSAAPRRLLASQFYSRCVQ